MPIEDIGYLIFAQFLGMTEYPGAPFTGQIARDLILFLLVPSIFIIMIVFVLLGRIAVQQRQIRMLLGVGIYLFILASGYYRTFALLAGPYFIVLIFVLGLIYFIPSHFRVRGGGMPGRSAGGGGSYGSRLNPINRRTVNKEIEKLQKDLAVADVQLAEARRGNHDRAVQDAQADVRRIKKAIRELEDEIDLAA